MSLVAPVPRLLLKGRDPRGDTALTDSNETGRTNGEEPEARH